jgi:hypothetical protein
MILVDAVHDRANHLHLNYYFDLNAGPLTPQPQGLGTGLQPHDIPQRG